MHEVACREVSFQDDTSAAIAPTPSLAWRLVIAPMARALADSASHFARDRAIDINRAQSPAWHDVVEV